MYERQIARGVMLLNAKQLGWYQGLREIDMVTPSDCVLGQIFGDYFSHAAGQLVGFEGEQPTSPFAPNLHAYNAHMAQYGFSLPTVEGSEIDDREDWETLGDEWQEVIDGLQQPIRPDPLATIKRMRLGI